MYWMKATRSPMLMRSAIDPAGESDLELEGDVGLGQRFQQVIADVQPDWEEKLASVVGDVRLGRDVGVGGVVDEPLSLPALTATKLARQSASFAHWRDRHLGETSQPSCFDKLSTGKLRLRQGQ